MCFALSSNILAHLYPFHLFKQLYPMRSLKFAWLADRSRSLHCHWTLQPCIHHSICPTLRTGVKGRGKAGARVYCQTGDFFLFLNMDDMGKVKGRCDVQERQCLGGLTIELIVRIYGHV
jgi:hypothetical protein